MSLISSFGSLPNPIKGLFMLATGASILSVASMFSPQYRPLGIWVFAGILVVAIVILLYRFWLYLRTKSKSGAFSRMLAKGGGAGLSPEDKARQDQVRQKFEEGIAVYRQAGKDLYSLPWFLLVGPAGSGKTEAIRRSNLSFPSGLQDQLQGVGGTINMHWWFTSNAVVLDTAGALFMTGLEGPRAGEWKEFLKLLRVTRSNCPINGLLLVISSESLLKDSAEKIEENAGIIARQLDLVQRTLDVRFPVSVIITKCDKIVGFREFFETLNDPVLQHQILGWANPASLDDPFRPEAVDQHLETVRQKLIRRRFGLMQNPVHTSDPNARRTDQVDELFELPDNLVRIAPRLRRYLEMIFMAGEWSPKPLFLRGIYFTSSMRQGQVLDMTLASVLGVDAEALPGSRQWDEEKAYFLRDVFMSKVFPERGLVTRATNVSRELARQRRLIAIGSIVAIVVLAGFTVLAWTQFRSSLGPPSDFWRKSKVAFTGDPAQQIDPADLALLGEEGSGKDRKYVYAGGRQIKGADELPAQVERRAEMVIETGKHTGKIETPALARPVGLFLGFGDGFEESQMKAHRAVLEHTTIVPLLRATRDKLQNEGEWGPSAVRALTQLVRLQTYAFGSKPSEGKSESLVSSITGSNKAEKPAAIDVDALFRYVLGEEEYSRKDGYQVDAERLKRAVRAAFPDGFSKDDAPDASLAGKDQASVLVVSDAVDRLLKHMLALGATPGSDVDNLMKLRDGLNDFRNQEQQLAGRPWIATSGTPAAPKDLGEYAQFESVVLERLDGLDKAAGKIDEVMGRMGSQGDPAKLVETAGAQLTAQIDGYFEQLLSQLPKAPGIGMSGVSGEKVDKALAALEPEPIRTIRDALEKNRPGVMDAVKKKLDELRGQLADVAPLLVPGLSGKQPERTYVAKLAALRGARDEVRAAGRAAVEEGTSSDELLASRVARLDEASAPNVRPISELASWTPDAAAIKAMPSGDGSSVINERDLSVKIARRIVELAQGRRLRALVEQGVKDWPTDSGLLKKRAEQMATTAIAEGKMERWVRPQVPLSEYEPGGEFSLSFHPDAAKAIMDDWAMVQQLSSASKGSGARWMLDAESVAASQTFKDRDKVSAEYARLYAKYWRDAALEDLRPAPKDWVSFSKEIRRADAELINEKLKQVRKKVDDALSNVPATMRGEEFDKTKGEVDGLFALADDAGFAQQCARTLRSWQSLARATTPADAGRQLRDSFADGTIKKRYFECYKAGGRGVKYWNDLFSQGLSVILTETQGDLGKARAALLNGAGVPLAFGPDSAKDLTAEQVKEIKQAADRLNAATGTSSTRIRDANADLDEELMSPLEELSGSNFVGRDEATRAWFLKVQKIAGLLGDTKPLTAQVSPGADPIPSAPSGLADVRDPFTYARLYINGQLIGKAFRTSGAPLPEVAAELRVSFPGAGATELRLYKRDPQQGEPEPDAKITLAGPWGLLRRMLVASGGAVRNDADGTWRVLTVTDDGKYFWWLNLKFETAPESPVPGKNGWPQVQDWPRQ